jgi:predicted TIM-barrel fold metal-dependent hydrolase
MSTSAITESTAPQPPTVVDCHTHAQPAWAMQAFRRWLGNTAGHDEGPASLWASRAFENQDLQLENLRAHGIDTAVLTHSSNTPAALRAAAPSTPMSGEADLSGTQTIARVNDELLAWAVSSHGHLVTTAWIDPRLPDSALAELERVTQGGAVGASMLCAYPDRSRGLLFLDAPQFAPVLKAAAVARVPLFLHASAKYPLFAVAGPPIVGLPGHCLTGGLSMLVESTLCLLRLVLTGTFERLPELRVVAGQLGGVLPFVAGRMDLIRTLLSAEFGVDPLMSSSSIGVLRDLRDYSDNLYLDTHSMNAAALECALEFLGPERIVFGSDFPVTPDQLGRASGLELIYKLGLPTVDRDAILGGNARQLLGLVANRDFPVEITTFDHESALSSSD